MHTPWIDRSLQEYSRDINNLAKILDTEAKPRFAHIRRKLQTFEEKPNQHIQKMGPCGAKINSGITHNFS